ncbi:MAG: tRNA (adenosine(37)-N6)-threonylcarbamoyltransferase complex transferase subunit TsaD [Oscillospiraceae bacterium]|jgi:N6-L-threonylcarbamoyladenine synthase|nr:tRNA (adenosine(37)-N6)-threonylcarbamoyltransferase complex transferase subunit TsaD [Oscillospiraceae bacterium]
MVILAIDSSCDETAAAVVEDGRRIRSNLLVSQIEMHSVYGGVVPEMASRKHVEVIDGLTRAAVSEAGVTLGELDAVAVTNAPGLIGALLVGVNFAKGLAFALNKPLIPVHHIRGHCAANYLEYGDLEPPFCALVASGGHTLILGADSYTSYRVIGSTRDDAAGEVFDKVARTLGLGYPGGRIIDQLAGDGDDTMYRLPRARVDSSPYDMSFSGLKTAVINLIQNAGQRGDKMDINGLAASFQRAVSDTVVPRTILAAKEYGYNKICMAGGAAANSRIRGDLEKAAAAAGLKLYLPPVSLCGDNAAMIGSQAYYEYLAGGTAGMDLNAYATKEVTGV